MGDSLKSLSDLLGKEEEGAKVASWGDFSWKQKTWMAQLMNMESRLMLITWQHTKRLIYRMYVSQILEVF